MDNKESKQKAKRVAAVTGLVLIGIMIIATLLTAIFDSTGVYFRSCLIITIALPLALWITLWAFGAMTKKHTIASVDLNLVNPDLADDGDEESDSQEQ